MGSTGRILQDFRCMVGSGNTVMLVTVDTIVLNTVSEAKTSGTQSVLGTL